MKWTIAIGVQNFESLRKNHYFFIDKTNFIKEWWENGDTVTVIIHPGRFGKILNLSMTGHFFRHVCRVFRLIRSIVHLE